MGIDRRTWLAGAAGGVLLAAGLRPSRAGPRAAVSRARGGAPEDLYLSARADGSGGFHASAFDGAGRRRLDCRLPARGHALALHLNRAVAVYLARRPGTFVRIVDLARGEAAGGFETPPGRHLYGHGVFSPDGRWLYTTENDYERARGVIGIYDAADGWRRVGEHPAHGIGPHEVVLLADGETLAVAVGGIATHPDAPRVKLNVPTMVPALAYVDRRSGRLLEEVRLPPVRHRLGIRHLAVAPDGRVAVAMQVATPGEGAGGDPADLTAPLVGLHGRGKAIALLDAPATAWAAMRGYCGGVAFDRSGRYLAASAPRGHAIVVFDAATGRHLRSVAWPDGSGIGPAARSGVFLATSGRGGAMRIDAATGETAPLHSEFIDGARWDNHLVAA